MVSLRRHCGATTPPLWYHYAAVVVGFPGLNPCAVGRERRAWPVPATCFHAPYGCEPVKGVLKMVRASVSIHAPYGRELEGITSNFADLLFQSTRPYGRELQSFLRTN
jgi:hypothetical protein